MKSYHRPQTIKSLYFDLLTRLYKDSYQTILKQLADTLVTITNSNCIVIFSYNTWLQTFDKSVTAGELKDVVEDRFVCEKTKYPYSRLQKMFPEMSFQVMYPGSGADRLMIAISITPDAIQSKYWAILKTKTYTFVRTYFSYLYERLEAKQLSVLYKSATKLNKLSSENDIWLEMKKNLEYLYPQFSYELYLSQEYQSDHIFPVHMIAGGENNYKDKSAKAFMTGNIEIEQDSTTTSIYAPLRGEQGVYGVVKLIFPELIYLPEEERYFMMRFFNMVGKALENTILYERSNRAVSNMKWLIDVTEQLNQNQELNEIVPFVRDQILKLCQASHLGVVLYDTKEKDTYEIQPESTSYFHTESGQAFTSYIIEHLQKNSTSILSGNMKERTDLATYESVMAVPMQYREGMGGAIIAIADRPYYFSLEEMKLAQTFIQHASLAFANALLTSELKINAITDDLTGLYTRRHVDEKVLDHMKSGTNGALIFFDIDNFKDINDTYGHHTGDEVIIQIAHIIKRLSLEDAWASRWGGEELALYLPGFWIDSGYAMATAILEATANETEPAVTMSCGISAWTEWTSDSARELFTRADQALYEAKSTGKNKIVVAKHIKGATTFTPC